jgi:hypothetical protein
MEVVSFAIGFFSFQIGWIIGEYITNKIIVINKTNIVEKLTIIETKLGEIETKLDRMG